jgi:hypothetical protein
MRNRYIQITGPGAPEGGPRLEYLAYVFVLSVVYYLSIVKVTLSDQAPVALQQIISLSDLYQSAVAEGPRKIFLTRRKTALGGPGLGTNTSIELG